MSELFLKDKEFFLETKDISLDCFEAAIPVAGDVTIGEEDPLETAAAANLTDAKLPQATNENEKTKQKGSKGRKAKLKKNFVDEVVDDIYERLKNPVGFLFDIVDEKAKKYDEATEKRMLKHRLLTMKARFLLELDAPEKAEAERKRASEQTRQLRKQRKAMETPEEKRARLERQRVLAATSRQRQKELETPEQRAARMAKDREQTKLRMHKRLAAETPEQRAARRQRQREYEEKKKADCILTKTGQLRRRCRKRKNATETIIPDDVNKEEETNVILESSGVGGCT